MFKQDNGLDGKKNKKNEKEYQTIYLFTFKQKWSEI